ncbi:MAG: hypothetical protein ABR535_09855 [Pyrinomonadaceae bacterium]
MPRSNDAVYRRIRAAFENEFLTTFGDYALITDLNGSYTNESGGVDVDVIDLLYVDAPFDLEKHRHPVAIYAAALQQVVLETTPEESVLVVVHETLHAESREA